VNSTRGIITDFGRSLEAVPVSGGDPIHVDRYGVWKWNPHKQRHEVVATGDDLAALKLEHGELEVVAIFI
jgi:hypothetical protein